MKDYYDYRAARNLLVERKISLEYYNAVVDYAKERARELEAQIDSMEKALVDFEVDQGIPTEDSK